MLTQTLFQHSKRKNTGFTLVELMVALVIFGILVGAGVPALQGFLNNMASRTNADQLAAAISFTRQTAVARGESFTICSNDGSDACGGNNEWTNGWIIYPASGSAAAPLKVADVSENRSTVAGDQSTITFNARGENVGAETTLVMCNVEQDVATARVLKISVSGSLTNAGKLTGTATC